MIPQGSTLINTDHFVNVIESVNACETCVQLQSVVNDSFASLNAVKAGIQAELASLAPVLGLLTPPSANPAAIVTWITSFVSTTLTPLVKPTITYAAQLDAMTLQLAQVTAAIDEAAGRLTSCAIVIPA